MGYGLWRLRLNILTNNERNERNLNMVAARIYPDMESSEKSSDINRKAFENKGVIADKEFDYLLSILQDPKGAKEINDAVRFALIFSTLRREVKETPAQRERAIVVLDRYLKEARGVEFAVQDSALKYAIKLKSPSLKRLGQDYLGSNDKNISAAAKACIDASNK